MSSNFVMSNDLFDYSKRQLTSTGSMTDLVRATILFAHSFLVGRASQLSRNPDRLFEGSLASCVHFQTSSPKLRA